MASQLAIDGVSKSLIALLKDSYDPAAFNDQELEFEVYVSKDFSTPMKQGISLFLYRLIANGSYRIPEGRLAPDGRRYGTQLPLDLHYLMTIWAEQASLQHSLAGWLMRTLEDTPVLPFGLLEREAPAVFQADETVEVLLDDLGNEDLFRLSDLLMKDGYRLSIPYLVRQVRIESRHRVPVGPPVHERQFEYRELPGQ